MKKFILLTLSLMVLTQCSQTNITEDIAVENPSDEATLAFNYQGLGKTSEEFVSNWNKLVNTISEDEDTILYFSMNPDNVKWTSEQREALYYSFGDTGDESSFYNIFVNIFIFHIVCFCTWSW